MTSMSAFNFKYRIGLLALEVVMVLCRICSADVQTDEDFTPGTLSRRCSKNTLIPCITSDCSPERSISGVICNFAVFTLSSWVAVVKRDPFFIYLFVYLFVSLRLCFVSCIRTWAVITGKASLSGVTVLQARGPADQVSLSFIIWRAASHYVLYIKLTAP